MYSQLNEDSIIQDICKQNRWDIEAYLDVGANNPVEGSNTFFFYTLGIRGLLIEPLRMYFEQYKKHRPGDEVWPYAVVAKPGMGQIPFYQLTANTLSSSSLEDVAAIVKAPGYGKQEVIDKYPVETCTITECIEHFSDIQVKNLLVSIDIEGRELEIISSYKFAKRPLCFCIEVNGGGASLEKPVEEVMKAHHYIKKHSTGLNDIYFDSLR